MQLVTSLNAFFYLFTTIRPILHIIGGIYFWGKTTSKFIKRSQEEINNLNDICAVYWHFLLVVLACTFWINVNKLRIINYVRFFIRKSTKRLEKRT